MLTIKKRREIGQAGRMKQNGRPQEGDIQYSLRTFPSLTVVDGCFVDGCSAVVAEDGWRYWINFPWASIKIIVCSQIDRGWVFFYL